MAKVRASLERLIASLGPDAALEHGGEVDVTGIATDSRTVRPGDLFVALRGEHHDGGAFAAQAVARGASAIVVQGDATSPEQSVPIVRVGDARVALSRLSAELFGHPSRALAVAGVTGTNGKTTTVAMVRAIAQSAGLACGTIGTTGAAFGERRWTLAHTTPLPSDLHAILAEMRDAGAQAVAMEVSSHALALHRVDDVRFSVAALTNVTRDHLDFHGTMDAYAATKRQLLDRAPLAVLDLDDAYGSAWANDRRANGAPTLGYSCVQPADVRAERIELEPGESRFRVDGRQFTLHVPGRFNVRNALCAIGIARVWKISDAVSARGLAALARVPGRMERIAGREIEVVVDYAHTPDALGRVLQSLRETAPHNLTVVFGCGGDRDRGKRPEMGAVAARYADAIVVTSDNPRGEDPAAIASQIAGGIGAHSYTIELDRRSAIRAAIASANPGDVVLLAGKGHETYQIVGDRVLPFDDAAEARAALALRGSPA